MEKSDDHTAKPITERYPDHQWLVKGAFITALATNFGHSVTRVWDLFYDNWKNNPLFSDLRADRDKATLKLSEQAKRTPMTHSEATEAKRIIENTWSTGFNKRLKETLGIESEGWGVLKGTYQRFDSLGSHTKAKLVFNTVFTTAAAIGGYMLINQNANMKRDMGTMQDRLDEERRANHGNHTER